MTKANGICYGCGSPILGESMPRSWYCPHCWSFIYKFNKKSKGGRFQPGQKCSDCGNEATGRDHRDYSKPHEFDYICRPCNYKRGPGKLPMNIIEQSRQRVGQIVKAEKEKQA